MQSVRDGFDLHRAAWSVSATQQLRDAVENGRAERVAELIRTNPIVVFRILQEAELREQGVQGLNQAMAVIGQRRVRSIVRDALHELDAASEEDVGGFDPPDAVLDRRPLVTLLGT